MPAMALSRVGARVVESGPGGQDLAPAAWQRLEALPDPRSPQGRIYPLACLIAIALCAFTAAGNDRLTAVGQWIKRASQQDLARLRAPWDPLAGRYRAPDEKTIRVVLDRLDPRALTRALLGPRPRRARCPGGPPSASVRPAGSAVTHHSGTGFVVCAVCGPPVSSRARFQLTTVLAQLRVLPMIRLRACHLSVSENVSAGSADWLPEHSVW